MKIEEINQLIKAGHYHIVKEAPRVTKASKRSSKKR